MKTLIYVLTQHIQDAIDTQQSSSCVHPNKHTYLEATVEKWHYSHAMLDSSLIRCTYPRECLTAVTT